MFGLLADEEQPLIIIFHRGCVGSCVCKTEKLGRLQERHTVKHVWECEWNSMKKQEPLVKAFVESLKWVD